MFKGTKALLILSFLAISCQSQNEDKEESFSFGSRIEEERQLNQRESNMAFHICLALESKRLEFEKRGGEEVLFETSEVSCGDDSFSPPNTVSAQLNVPTRGNMHFSTVGGGRLLTDIITDEQGILKELCEDATGGDKMSNTLDLGNTKYQFHFQEVDEFHAFQVARYRAGDNGNFNRPDLIEQYLIYTPKVTDDESLDGIVHERQRAVPCEGDRKIFRQTFRNFL